MTDEGQMMAGQNGRMRSALFRAVSSNRAASSMIGAVAAAKTESSFGIRRQGIRNSGHIREKYHELFNKLSDSI